MNKPWAIAILVLAIFVKLPSDKICEQSNDGCNACIRECGGDGWLCSSVACLSERAKCERAAMGDGRNPKDCTKQRKKP